MGKGHQTDTQTDRQKDMSTQWLTRPRGHISPMDLWESNIRHYDFRPPSPFLRSPPSGSDHAPWILKRGGLESSGQRLIYSIRFIDILGFQFFFGFFKDIFWIFFGFNLFLKLLKLLQKVTEVTTKHQKWPKICHLFFPKGKKKALGAVMSEYHKMDTNKYKNIFGCHIFTKQISKYICTPDIAPIQTRIIF